MAHNLKPVYPAYHPLFMGDCRDCGNSKCSNDLLADLDKPGDYVCSKCVFVFYLFDPRDLQIERDSKELREYGGLFQK